MNGYNINASVAFKNPTPFNIQVVRHSPFSPPQPNENRKETILTLPQGTVGFNLTIGDKDLGYVDIPDLYLRQDHTNADILGNIDIKTLVHQGIWKSNSEKLGKVTMGLHGNRSVYDGKEIPYFTAAFKAVNVSLDVDLVKYAKYLLDGAHRTRSD